MRMRLCFNDLNLTSLLTKTGPIDDRDKRGANCVSIYGKLTFGENITAAGPAT